MVPFAMLGPGELWPIALIVILLFGAKRLPEMARSMGEGIKEFKKGVNEIHSDTDVVVSKDKTAD